VVRNEGVLNPLRIRWEWITGGSMCLGYGMLMLCRTTVGVAGPAMLLDADLHLNTTIFGAILGWGMAGNLLGKLTNGVLADRLGGRKTFVLALCITATAIGVFGAVSGSSSFFLFYFLTLFAKSAGWPAMANLIKVWFARQKHGRMWGFISTSSRASSVGATLLLSSLLLIVSWRGLFFVAAAITAVVVAVLLKFLKDNPSEVDVLPSDSPETGTPFPDPTRRHPADELGTLAALGVFFRSPRFWLISISLMCLAVLFEFQVFLPLYLSESFELSPAEAGIASSVFPLGCLISVFAGGFVYDKISKKALIAALGGVLGLGLPCLTLLWMLPNISVNPRSELVLTIGTIFLFGCSISPAYYLPMSVFSINFGGRHCGLLIGLIDAFGYTGAMVFDFAGGSIADQQGGWQSFLIILMVVSLTVTVTMTAFLYMDFRHSLPLRKHDPAFQT
jgi:OPA family sugar phosphate sensor protein UhpC-like MFS transporter